ncbi:hypothetical protein JOF41_002417 [Saccharothrix coeruleofusca]|uniref:hypothetical protein n=1 Tax=Saccharothrix coeruleofusca TaxID=33919 RepID=UPI001AE20F42|nr:hypothetical protein [Saccharothrix coeruleofusca]MBP2336239.1 hypothetical protein [Saccharothrix coeruleofusca]
MTGTDLGAALVAWALLWGAGLALFGLACRLSAQQPRPAREARRIAAWQRASPWALGVCSVVATAGVLLLAFTG